MTLPDGQLVNASNTVAQGGSVQIKKRFWRRWFQIFRNENSTSHRQRARSRRFLVRSLLMGATVSVGTLALGSYQVVRNIILDNSKKQALSKAHQGSGDIDQWLASRKAEVVVLANSPITCTMNWSVVQPYFKAEVKRQQDFDQLTSFTSTSASCFGRN